jgi:hypothetical protein
LGLIDALLPGQVAALIFLFSLGNLDVSDTAFFLFHSGCLGTANNGRFLSL